MSNIIEFKNEINKQIADKEVFTTLLQTTFKGLEPVVAKRAMLEGLMRGYEFKDFLEKNVYAIPFKQSYSLVTSVDFARKVGMRSGVVGVSAPIYDLDDTGKVISCSITVKRKVDNYVGEYSATVFFEEYNTGYNLWKTKPKTMIAKVAEMHALRKACPETLSQAYIEEDYQKEEGKTEVDENYQKEIDAIGSLEELKVYYLANKGKGKDFDKYVSKRKKELQNS